MGRTTSDDYSSDDFQLSTSVYLLGVFCEVLEGQSALKQEGRITDLKEKKVVGVIITQRNPHSLNWLFL